MSSAFPARLVPALALVCASTLPADASAAVVMSLQQEGANVVLRYSGTVNTQGLAPIGGGFNQFPGVLLPNQGIIGATNAAAFDAYQGNLTGDPFGSSNNTFLASSATGDFFEVYPTIAALFVPVGYQSGAALSGTATWNNTTLAALTLTTGIYDWTWGAGANADSATLYLGVPVPVPEPASLALAALGLALCVGGLGRGAGRQALVRTRQR